jgi:hypothetical protein
MKSSNFPAEGVVRGGLGGFFLQSQVHALVAGILLGMSGHDALDVDTQPQPPYPEQRIAAGEGHAVVSMDGFGQAKFFEHPLEVNA